jgi:glycosyltransferase involved in cell wall biosynthesis
VRIGLIADAYPPLRTSCAVQMRDMARTLAAMEHEVTVLVPAPDQRDRWCVDWDGAVEVVRLKAPQTKGVGYIRRTLAEFAMSTAMWRNMRGSPAAVRRFDGIAWYSPSIFFAPLVHALKHRDRCPSYLILRDIFPDWMADTGLIRRGPAFHLLRSIARRQYRAADAIGVQSPANLPLVEASADADTRIEVLENWLAPPTDRGCPIDLSTGPLKGRRIFVYAGNMGVAQGMGRLLDLALHERRDIGFAYVGRGSDAAALRAESAARGLANVAFFDEIDPDDIPGLYAQCHAGMVALDPRHKTHNVPGKFISYMHAGLPVLASINPGNDLIQLIEDEGVGYVSTDASGGDLATLAIALTENKLGASVQQRCQELAASRYSASAAATQLSKTLLSLRAEFQCRP